MACPCEAHGTFGKLFVKRSGSKSGTEIMSASFRVPVGNQSARGPTDSSAIASRSLPETSGGCRVDQPRSPNAIVSAQCICSISMVIRQLNALPCTATHRRFNTTQTPPTRVPDLCHIHNAFNPTSHQLRCQHSIPWQSALIHTFLMGPLKLAA